MAKKSKGGTKSADKAASGLAAGMKIKPGPSGKMYGTQKVSPQKSGVSATSQTRGRSSYAK